MIVRVLYRGKGKRELVHLIGKWLVVGALRDQTQSVTIFSFPVVYPDASGKGTVVTRCSSDTERVHVSRSFSVPDTVDRR